MLVPMLLALAPVRAHAALQPVNPIATKICLTTNTSGLASRIIGCTEQALKSATKTLASAIQSEVGNAATSACALAVLIAGFAVVGGRTPTWDGPYRTAVNVIIVTALSGSIGSNIDKVYDFMQELVNAVTVMPSSGTCKDATMWKIMDCQLNKLVGGVLGGNVKSGIVGFLGSALISGGVGAFIAVMGAVLLLYYIYALLQATYIYITAMVALAMILMVSPLFIPLILFSATRHYFNSWLNMLFSFIMQPVALFAYLSVMLLAFDSLVFTGNKSLYAIIGTKPWMGTVQDNFASTAITVNQNKAANEKLTGMGATVVGVPGQSLVKKGDCSTRTDAIKVLDCLGTDYLLDKETMRNAQRFFSVEAKMHVINWGTNYSNFGGPAGILSFALSFMSAALTAYVLFSLMEYLPYIGAGISGGGKGVPVFGRGTLEPTNNLIAKSMKSAITGGS